MKKRTHYDNLQVTRTASDLVIKAAYRSLSQKYHPDKFDGPPQEALRIMQILNRAYEILSHPERRKEYDQTIRDDECAESADSRDAEEPMPQTDSPPPSSNQPSPSKEEMYRRHASEQAARGKTLRDIESELFLGGCHSKLAYQIAKEATAQYPTVYPFIDSPISLFLFAILVSSVYLGRHDSGASLINVFLSTDFLELVMRSAVTLSLVSLIAFLAVRGRTDKTKTRRFVSVCIIISTIIGMVGSSPKWISTKPSSQIIQLDHLTEFLRAIFE
jgi:hypothetical protein